jgi:membrane-associated phospholipid phosphatase
MSARFAVVLIAFAALAAPPVAAADVVTDWNKTMVDALLVSHTSPPASTRVGAIVQASVYDAVNGISRRYTQFHPEVIRATPPHGTSARAAVAGAAYTALVALFPALKATFDARLGETLARLSDDDNDDDHGDDDHGAVARGLVWGETVANAILAWRSTDGFGLIPPPYEVGPLPFWQPTPPDFLLPVARQFATMRPWAMTSPSQFLPPPPPALTSARYAADFNETKTIGNAATSAPELVDTALFWNGQDDTAATIWNRVAESLADEHHSTLVGNARRFALLNIAMADAVIAVWNAKNTYNAWRPITAIEHADIDGNPSTQPDPNWTPVLVTPAHQEYPSGHSGVSSAAASELADFFGSHTSFTVTTDAPSSGTTSRTYASFADAIADVALARIAAGIHFRFSCEAAVQMGTSIADYARSTQMRRLPD